MGKGLPTVYGAWYKQGSERASRVTKGSNRTVVTRRSGLGPQKGSVLKVQGRQVWSRGERVPDEMVDSSETANTTRPNKLSSTVSSLHD